MAAVTDASVSVSAQVALVVQFTNGFSVPFEFSNYAIILGPKLAPFLLSSTFIEAQVWQY